MWTWNPYSSNSSQQRWVSLHYVAENIRLLARVLPNPAVQNNYLYLFAAEGCRNTGQTQPDAFELIEVLERPLADIPDLIASGEIAHSMVIAAFAFMGLVKPTARLPC